MIAFPNAKINIGLDILRRRPDGYHDLCTVMMPVAWCDILEIVHAAPGADDTLTVTGRRVDCPPEKNLVMRAVRALRAVAPFPPVEVHLHKVIPDGAGLGGGSADAAFTLTLLRSLFSLDIDDAHLAAVAASLGADCPFFIYNCPMLCTGTGIELAPFALELPQGARIAIVKPPVSVSTAEAYAKVHPAVPTIDLPSLLRSLPVEKWSGKVVNGFEESVFPGHPELPAIKEQLLGLGALYASMSGSGSAIYAIFPSGADTDARPLSDIVAEKFEGCDTFVSDPL